MDNSIQELVLHVVAAYLGKAAARLQRDSQLEEEFGLDSTEMVCIAVDLERKLGVSLKGIKFSALKTPDDVAAAIVEMHPDVLAAEAA